jgi:hypothetical protein
MSEWGFHVDGPGSWTHDATDDVHVDLGGFDTHLVDLDAHFDTHFDAHGDALADWDFGTDHTLDTHWDPDAADHELPHTDDLHLDDLHFGDDYTGAYDLVGADPHEHGLWDQLMLDMSDEVNPYAVN